MEDLVDEINEQVADVTATVGANNSTNFREHNWYWKSNNYW